MSELGGSLPQIHENDHQAVKVLKRVDKVFATVELAIMSLALAFLVLLGFYRALYESTKRWGEGTDVVDRAWRWIHNFLHAPPEWSTPTILLLVFVVGMLGLCLAAYSERLIAIDVFSRRFKPRIKLTFRILSNLFTIFVLYYFILGAMYFRRTSLGEETSAAGRLVSNHSAVLIFPIITGLVMLHLGLKAIMDAIMLATGKLPPPEPHAKQASNHDGIDAAAVVALKAKEPAEAEADEALDKEAAADKAEAEAKPKPKAEAKAKPKADDKKGGESK